MLKNASGLRDCHARKPLNEVMQRGIVFKVLE